jgi:hypothetical protein
MMKTSSLLSGVACVASAIAQQPGGKINSAEALASPGKGKYGAVRNLRLNCRG